MLMVGGKANRRGMMRMVMIEVLIVSYCLSLLSTFSEVTGLHLMNKTEIKLAMMPIEGTIIGK